MVHQFHTEIRQEDSYDEWSVQREREREREREQEQEGEMLKQLNLARSHMFPQHAVLLSFLFIQLHTHTHTQTYKVSLSDPPRSKNRCCTRWQSCTIEGMEWNEVKPPVPLPAHRFNTSTACMCVSICCL